MQKRSDPTLLPQVPLVWISLFIQRHFSCVCSRVSLVPVCLLLTPLLIALAGKECVSDQFLCFPGLAGSFSNHRFSSGTRRTSQHLLYYRPRPLTHPGNCLYACVSEYHYGSGYEKDGDTLLLFADINMLLERFVFTLRLLWKRTGGVNYLRKHVVEIRLQCQHCVGVTLLMGNSKTELFPRAGVRVFTCSDCRNG